MKDHSGFKQALSIPWAYEAFQRLIGARGIRRWLAQEFWRCPPKAKVVDLGCGPGGILEFLPPETDYVGLDQSRGYIDQARRRYGSRGRFVVGTVTELARIPEVQGADLILCTGLLHHLDDSEADGVFAFAKQTLVPGGRLACYEPCYLRKQGPLSRWIMGHDRGQNVRSESEWKRLATRHFSDARTDIVTGAIRLPYVHILIECMRSALST